MCTARHISNIPIIGIMTDNRKPGIRVLLPDQVTEKTPEMHIQGLLSRRNQDHPHPGPNIIQTAQGDSVIV